MLYNINLKQNLGFKWYSTKTLKVKGYAYINDGNYIEGADLLNYLNEHINQNNISKFLSCINGVLSVIYEIENRLFLFSDKTRFFPLFYTCNKNDITVSDDPYSLIAAHSNLNTDAVKEFKHLGFVSGSDTIIDTVKQVKSAELLALDNGHLSSKILFKYSVSQSELYSATYAKREISGIIDKAGIRLASSLKDKTPILPLSGGFDSRLIACILKNHGFNNTICFTYGRLNSEVELSQRVADKLGFKWFHINYEDYLKHVQPVNEPDFDEHTKFCSKLTSMFYLQEYPAMKYLMENEILPDNSVFLPGHSGDLLGGSQFYKTFHPKIRHQKIIRQIIKTKYIHFPLNRRDKIIFKKRVKNCLLNNSKFIPYSVFEDWDVREKIAKFIFNSSQVFTFYNYPVRFFFWDKKLVDFFRKLPATLKIQKSLYDDCLKNHYFSKYNLNFSNEIPVDLQTLRIQKIKNLIKKFLPESVKRKNIDQNDWACYKDMSESMMLNFSETQHKMLPYKDYNSVLINWYIKKTIDLLLRNSDQYNNAIEKDL